MPVRFRSLGDRDIQGFLITLDQPLQHGDSARRRPLIVTTHGYGSQCNPVIEARHTVAAEADLFCFDVRGFGLSRAAVPPDPRGHIITGLTNPETSILRGAVCDFVRAAEVGRRLGAGEGGVVFHGRSFGGGLAVMAQAVSQLATYLAVAVPTFGWAEGRRRLVKAGSGQEVNDYLEAHPSRAAAVMRTLTYFDPVNFAGQVNCPALVGVGRRDDIVPPETVYAIANHMAPAPVIMELPVSHSDDPAERRWVEFDKRWTAQVARLGASGRP